MELLRKIELWPLERLIPYERNPRVHTEEEVQLLVATIRAVGRWTNPIVVDETDGILSGHKRLKAARVLNMTQVPVVVVTGLTEAQKRAYIIGDNQNARVGSYDLTLLRQELDYLQRTQPALLAATAFSTEELEAALDGIRDPFAPNLDPATGGEGDVDDQDVRDAADNMNDRMFRDQELTKVVCPDCGSEFHVDVKVAQ